MEFLIKSWPWYISGPLIGLMVPLLLILGNRSFGISSSLRHICAMCIPGKVGYFKYDWKSELWSVFFVFGVLIGGFLASEFFTGPVIINISSSTKEQLGLLGITNFNQVGIWNGTIHDCTIPGSGNIINWEFKNDNTMLGNWMFYPDSGGAISLDIGGNYSFGTNQISFNVTGSATYTHPVYGNLTSNYTLIVDGSLSSDTEAEGTYSIDFVDPQWPDHFGNWSVTKNGG